MDIQNLKEQIQNKNILQDVFIFVDKQRFLCRYYYKAISKLLKKDIFVTQNFSQAGEIDTLFGGLDNNMYIYFCDIFDDLSIKNKHNIIVVTNKVSDRVKKEFDKYILEFTEITKKNVGGYAIARGKGIDKQKLENLVVLSNYNVYRIDSELNKLRLFKEEERNDLFDKFIEDGMYNDLSEFDTFTLVNAILSKDEQKVCQILKKGNNMDINSFGFVTILYNNIKNIIAIRFNGNTQAEDLGISEKQLMAIKYRANSYTPHQLISIFNLLTSIDQKVKTGELPMEYIVDYVILKILSFSDNKIEINMGE